MFAIHPHYRARLDAAGVTTFDAAVALRPTDDFVEKQRRSTGRYRVEIAGEVLSLYLKKHYRLPWWRRLFASPATYPGPHEWRNMEIASSLGVRIPDAVFAGAERGSDCASVLAVRELEGYLPLHIYVPGPLARMPEPARRRRRRALIARLVETARRLHEGGYYHRDFYLCHFFLRDDAAAPDGFDLALIDFGRLTRSRLGRWRVKDLAGLLFSTYGTDVSSTDCLRFFKQYLGTAKLDGRTKRLARQIVAKAERYRRHNDARRAA